MQTFTGQFDIAENGVEKVVAIMGYPIASTCEIRLNSRYPCYLENILQICGKTVICEIGLAEAFFSVTRPFSSRKG
jgi:hypothetical protein